MLKTVIFLKKKSYVLLQGGDAPFALRAGRPAGGERLLRQVCWIKRRVFPQTQPTQCHSALPGVQEALLQVRGGRESPFPIQLKKCKKKQNISPF